jgi:response regulator of citrate/malate metabolism
MAARGTPLPFNVRQQIKEQRASETVRRIADTLKVSKTTVQKYGGKYGTKP